MLTISYVVGQGRTTGSIGTVTIDGKLWNQVALRPVTPLWRFDVAWDLVLYFDQDGNFYSEHWDFSSFTAGKNSVLDKVYYLSYGHKTDILYFKIGALNRVDLGYGILVSGYSNAVQYPEIRNIGMDIRYNTTHGRLSGFVNDFKQNVGIAGVRYKLPKLFPVPTAVTIVLDRSQYLGLKDVDEDGRPNLVDDFPFDMEYWLDSDGDGLADNHPAEFDRDGDGFPDVHNLNAIHAFWDTLGAAVGQDFSAESYYDSLPDQFININPAPLNMNTDLDPVMGIALDVGCPLFVQDNMSILVYVQAAKLVGKTIHPATRAKVNLGLGLVPLGITAHFGPARFTIEYRMIPRGQFEFSYWDRTYDLQRATFLTNNDSTFVITKESKLGRYGDQKGYYSRMGFQIGSFLDAGIGYQNLVGQIWDDLQGDYHTNENQSFQASLTLTKSINRLQSAQLFYQQHNVPNPFKFEYSESTIMGYRLGITIGSGLMLNYRYERSFRDIDGDGDVDGINEMINLTTIETTFSIW